MGGSAIIAQKRESENCGERGRMTNGDASSLTFALIMRKSTVSLSTGQISFCLYNDPISLQRWMPAAQSAKNRCEAQAAVCR